MLGFPRSRHAQRVAGIRADILERGALLPIDEIDEGAIFSSCMPMPGAVCHTPINCSGWG